MSLWTERKVIMAMEKEAIHNGLNFDMLRSCWAWLKQRMKSEKRKKA